jgi:N-acetyl-gamma-glutamyl-phosphate reductase
MSEFFTAILLSIEISLKQVINTNNCFIHLYKYEGLLLITSIIDNLIKGASGQAIQNLNLIMGWNENLGLNLKGSIF